jgi:class 3 adenylate cyclase
MGSRAREILVSDVVAREENRVVEARVDRRLAAILAVDIAGYSRLMGANEEGTLRQLKEHRKELNRSQDHRASRPNRQDQR